MSRVNGASEFGKSIADALGLPPHTVWFELRVAVDELVTVRLAYYVDIDSVKRGELVETLRTLEYRNVTAISDTAHICEMNRHDG